MVEEHKEKKKSKLDLLKEQYKPLQNKYSLPEFKILNENFEIETLAGEETEVLLKRIRKHLTEKISAGLRALEMFLNPQNAPIFIFKVIKSFTSTDKEVLDRTYNKFAGFEIEAFGLENDYDEKKEAEFIKKVCGEWKEICEDFNRIYSSMKLSYKKESKKHDKSYFG